jgi:hypothetical protein
MNITKKIEVKKIFPTPIYITELKNKLNETELKI